LNIEKHLILIKGEDRTEDISRCRYENRKWQVEFATGKTYAYNYPNVQCFLKSEEAEAHHGSPKYFELTFGMTGDHGDLGSCDAVPIHLSQDKQFHMRGRIDRVDETSDGLNVWDYKSGSPTNGADGCHFQDHC